MKLPVLIPYRATSDNGMELRYALRSLKNIKNWDGRVFIVGDREVWFKNIIYIPVKRRMYTPNLDVEFKLMAALADDRLPDDFILSNDDIYVTEPTTVTSLHKGKLLGSSQNFYQRAKKHTAEWLREQGIEEPLDYALHVPMIMNRQKRLEVHDLIQPSLNGTPLQARSVYGNMFKVGGKYYEDKKTKSRELPTGTYISTQYFTDELHPLFPEPAPFERQLPTVHMIWIGSELPTKYTKNILSYEKNGYIVKLWTKPPRLKNRNIYNAMKTWAGKADVMRLEILYQEGGLYVDIDSRMIKPFPAESDLVCMTSPNGYIANETIYAEPGHPALKEAIDNMSDHVESLQTMGHPVNLWDIAGATYITPIFTKYDHTMLGKSKIARRTQKPTVIAHDYEGSWNGTNKSAKHLLSYWMDISKL